MRAKDWPENWPPLSDLVMVLRARSPRGCRRGDFAEIDAKRGRGQIAVMGMGWISIRRRLLADGVAELGQDGALYFRRAAPEPAPEQADNLGELPEVELDALADWLRTRPALSIGDRKRFFALVASSRIYEGVTVSTPPIQADVSTNPIQPETESETAEAEDDLPD